MRPMYDAHAQMNQRGDKGMGFSQSATTHHFLLNSTGGVIQVPANDPADAASRDSVRMHLAHIAQAFPNGDFDISHVCSRHRYARGPGNEVCELVFIILSRRLPTAAVS